MGVKWIYTLSKEQLIAELNRHQIDSSGTVAALRQRLVAFVKSNPELFDETIDPVDYKEEDDISKDAIALEDPNLSIINPLPPPSQNPSTSNNQVQQFVGTTENNHPFSPVLPSNSSPSNTASDIFVLESMRKWGCSFDGSDPYAFLERLEELQSAYGFSDEQILRGFPVLLKGDTMLWYRNSIRSVRSLEQLITSLKQYYLSPSELRSLDYQISRKLQSKSESIRAFTISLQTLMRRHGGYNKVRELDTLYWNMLPVYRLHTRRTEVNEVNDLIQRVEEVAEILHLVNNEDKST